MSLITEPKAPQYLHLKFESEAACMAWLEETYTKKINLVDFQQDLLTIWIEKNGEVLYTNLQQNVWCGKFINLETLRPGSFIQMLFQDEKKWRDMKSLIVESIEIKGEDGATLEIEDDEDEMYEECLNCGSVWGIGSEEWQFQQCDSCGWNPGEPTDEELGDDDGYDQWEEEGWE